MGEREEELKQRFPEIVSLGGCFNGTERIWEEIKVWLDRDPCPEKDKEIEDYIRKNFLVVKDLKETRKVECKKVTFIKI